MDRDVLAALRPLLEERRVVPVVGAGVSVAAAGFPGWRQMLEDGFDHLGQLGTTSAGKLAEGRRLLEAGDLVAAASRVRRLLEAPAELPAWLKGLFREPERVESRVLHAIFDLGCPLVATTNYDRLLTNHHPDNARLVTWQQPALMQDALREGEPYVLHLHGVYDEPESVVFGRADYEALVDEPAYRGVLQTLWLDRTLLFVGCSFDGLEDPDFARLLDWASSAFAGSPYTHYALMKNGTFAPDDVTRLLRGSRIRVVGYGDAYDDLPAWLDALNPHREQARARRVERLRHALGERDPRDVITARNLAEGLGRVGSPADAGEPVRVMFERRTRALERQRRDLIAIQQLIRSIVEPAAVAEQVQSWAATRRDNVEPPAGFTQTVERAGGALFVVPEGLISALKRRGVEVHQRVIDGYCRELVAQMKRGHARGTDPYQRENMKRVLTSVQAILEADADDLFALPARDSRLATQEAALLAVREDRGLELRPLGAVETISASLGMNPGPLEAAVVRLGGERVIAAYSKELLVAWDPRRDDIPVAEYAISDAEAFGICSVAHRETPGGLSTRAATVSGFLHELIELEPVRVWRPLEGDGFLSDVFTLRDGGGLGRTHDNRIVGIGPGEQVVPLLAPDDLPALLADVPGLPPLSDASFGIFSAQLTTVDDRELLVLETQLDSPTAPDGIRETYGLLVFLAPADDGVALAGTFFAGQQLISSFDFATTPEGSPRLICTFLSEFDEEQDLVAWAHGVRTRDGVMFVREGSALRTYDDLISIAAVDHRSGFASDDSGGLFGFSTDGTWREVARDRDAKARQLLLVTW